MIDGEHLIIHHVGGRGGDRRFPILDEFEADIVNVLYDADASSVESMEASTIVLPSRPVILPVCLGAQKGIDTLHVLRTPAGSSLLAFNAGFFETFHAIGATDFDMDARSFETAAELKVDVTTLDDCVRQGIAPAPDFISLNTQGTELDIICGATDTVAAGVIAVQAEVSLYPLYRNQANLSQICDHMASLSYWLTDVMPHTAYVPSYKVGPKTVTPPIGFRRGGISLQTDVIFFKEPSAVARHHREPLLDLAKAVYISIVLGNYGMSYCYAAVADEKIPTTKRYLKFASAFIAAAKREPKILAPHNLARGESMDDNRNAYFCEHSIDEFRQSAGYLLSESYTGTERVCCEFGLSSAADKMREYRRIGMRGVCQRLGEPVS
jgi:hypothetical protein